MASKRPVKITLIGAGSTVFARNLLGDILAYPELAYCEISLYDIMVAAEGECLGLSGNFHGRSGRRLKQVWDEVREALVGKTKAYTLDRLVTSGPGEMYYI